MLEEQAVEAIDIVQIVNSAVIPRLETLDLAKDYNAKRLKTHFRNDTEIPFTYLEDIDFPTLAKFSEHDVGLPGVNIGIKPVREYLYGALASHLLGYVGMPVNVDQEEASHYTFYQPDVEGKSQIEFAMDKYLRGTPGVRVMQRSVKGVIEGEVKTVRAETGGERVPDHRCADTDDCRSRRCGSRCWGGRRRWWWTRITGISWRWRRFPHSIRIFSSRACRDRIGGC